MNDVLDATPLVKPDFRTATDAEMLTWLDKFPKEEFLKAGGIEGIKASFSAQRRMSDNIANAEMDVALQGLITKRRWRGVGIVAFPVTRLNLPFLLRTQYTLKREMMLALKGLQRDDPVHKVDLQARPEVVQVVPEDLLWDYYHNLQGQVYAGRDPNAFDDRFRGANIVLWDADGYPLVKPFAADSWGVAALIQDEQFVYFRETPHEAMKVAEELMWLKYNGTAEVPPDRFAVPKGVEMLRAFCKSWPEY